MSASRAQAGAVETGAQATGAAAAGAPVVVFTTPGCPYCKRAKDALRGRGVQYSEVDVSKDTALRAALGDATGQKTVPQIYVGGALVGGSDDLAAKMGDGSFDALLASAGGRLPEALRAAADAAAAAAQASAPPAAAGAAAAAPELRELAAALADPSAGILAGAAAASSGGAAAATFSSEELMAWLARRGSGGDRGAAAGLAARLLESNLVTLVAPRQPPPGDVAAVAPAARYRLLSDAPRAVEWGRPLNTHYWWGPSAARPADVVAEDLRARILALYDKHLSPDGSRVGYGAMRRDPDFWAYADATAELQRVDLSPLGCDALSAFAINLYNALVIHALVVHGTERYKTLAGRSQFFTKAARYTIGGYDYTLDDLENGILRGNRPPASSLGMLLGCPALSTGPFLTGDPRRQKVVTPVDARIHFALVCGAKSCPPIKLYSAANLGEGLQAAAEAFCASDVDVDVPGRAVTQSKIFKWYFPDFGANKAERLRWLLPYLPPPKRSALEGLLAADPGAGRISVKHREYDWSLNGDE